MFIKIFVVDMNLDMGLVWVCGPHVRLLQASQTTPAWVPCISMRLCRGGPPEHVDTKIPGRATPVSTQIGPMLLLLGSPTSHLGRLEFCGHVFLLS